MLQSMKKPDPKKRKLGKPQTVVAYEKKTLSAPKSISKADLESKVARIEGMKEEQAELTQGEKDFGSSYKSLGLKGTRRTELDPKSGEARVTAKYKSTAGDEEVERIPDSEMLKVKRIGEAGELAKGTDYENFKETFKDRIGRLASEKKAAGEAKYKDMLQKMGYSPKELAEHRRMFKDAGQEAPFDKFKKKFGLKEIGD